MTSRVAAGLLAGLLPLVLVLIGVRVVMTETYLRLEYQRAGFPADRYGWEPEVRLTYGPYGIRYLLDDKDISYLADLIIDGEPAFTPRELSHMEDVQRVTRGAFFVFWVTLGVVLTCVLLLAPSPANRLLLLRAIARGGLNTLVMIGALLMVAVVAWDFFFDSFHALFFAEGTWRFYNSDTLIRLYPPQFWFDSAVVVGILTIFMALMCAAVPRRWL